MPCLKRDCLIHLIYSCLICEMVIATFTFQVFRRIKWGFTCKEQRQGWMFHQQNSVCSLFSNICSLLFFSLCFKMLDYLLLLSYVIQNGNILINSSFFPILPIVSFLFSEGMFYLFCLISFISYLCLTMYFVPFFGYTFFLTKNQTFL